MSDDNWETPDVIFNRYNERYHFVLDAAANASNTKCQHWLGPASPDGADALAADWDAWLARGNIWCNPPYSHPLQDKFITKACEATLYGVRWDTAVVMLLPAKTDTRIFHDVIQPIGYVEFLRGRIKFERDGQPITKKGRPVGAPFGSLVCVFGRLVEDDYSR